MNRAILLSLGLVATLAAGSARAELMLNITGQPGSGQTTWSFSGSAIAVVSGEGAFEISLDLNNGDSWNNIGEYTSIDDFEAVPLFSNATLTIGSETRNIDLAYIDHDPSGDDIGVGVGDGGIPNAMSPDDNFLIPDGALVSWQGFLIAPIDINDISNGGLPATFLASAFDANPSDVELPLRINISVATPEPAGIILWGLGIIGLAGYWRRRQASPAIG